METYRLRYIILIFGGSIFFISLVFSCRSHKKGVVREQVLTEDKAKTKSIVVDTTLWTNIAINKECTIVGHDTLFQTESSKRVKFIDSLISNNTIRERVFFSYNIP